MAYFIVALILGILIGYGYGRYMINTSVSGRIMADVSDPDGPYLFLEVTDDINTVLKRDYVTLKIDISDCTSQK